MISLTHDHQTDERPLLAPPPRSRACDLSWVQISDDIEESEAPDENAFMDALMRYMAQPVENPDEPCPVMRFIIPSTQNER